MLEYIENAPFLSPSGPKLRELPPDMKQKLYDELQCVLVQKTGHSEEFLKAATKGGLDLIFDPERFEKLGIKERLAASVIKAEFGEKPDPVDFFLWGIERMIANGDKEVERLCHGILQGNTMQWPKKLRELPDKVKQQVYESAKPIIAKCAGQSWEKYEKNSRRFLHAVFTEKNPKWNPEGDPNDKTMIEFERRVVKGIRKEFATEPAFIDYMLWQLEVLIAEGRVKLGMMESLEWNTDD